MELQSHLKDINAEGLGLAAISYDPPATLRAFADTHGIQFPLLSDNGSSTIKRWGILNAEAAGRAAGIPHPGTFIVDTRGRIVSRAFEKAYEERQTATSILAARNQAGTPKPAKAPKIVKGRQLSVTSSQSATAAAPGTKLTLFADVFPGPKMHVYAPEQTGGYIRIELNLDDHGDLKMAAPVFPKASDYHFAPLDETFKVFEKPFRIRQDVTVALTPTLRKRAAANETLTIRATLRYQACDDQVCYRPDEVPLSWTIALQPLVGK